MLSVKNQRAMGSPVLASSCINYFFGGCIVLSLALSGCASQQQSSASKDKNAGDSADRSMTADATLSGIEYAPHGRGYDYKSTQLESADFSVWMKSGLPKLQEALAQMSPGSVLQVTGHTCSIGPREADPAQAKKGNTWYSLERANGVYQALIKAGIPARRLSVRGVADDEPVKGISTKDQRNRRITFKVVPAS